MKSIVLAGLTALAIPTGAALAQPYDDWGDQDEHAAIHDEVDAAHEAAHERGFRNEAEHEGYHRAMRQFHREFHYDHPDADNDIPLPPRYRQPSYGYYYGYPSYYGYAPYQPYYGSGWTFSWGRGW